MIIPYSTDAPVYHFPWMTLELIFTNAITFLITGMGEASHGWLLTFGRGLHPLEWVAYNFLHFGPFHLIGNMFFLWSFGIVVEGKLGWWRFLLLYLSIGICGGIFIQTLMLEFSPDSFVRTDVSTPRRDWDWSYRSVYAQDAIFNDGGANEQMPLPEEGIEGNNPQIPPEMVPFLKKLQKVREAAEEANKAPPEIVAGGGGASLAIYGLMAVVLIWAPRNEVLCFWMISMRAGIVEIEYLYFCGFYIVMEVAVALLSVRGLNVTSELGHATGAMIGFGLGTLFVKQDWVDCENWDLFSVMKGKHLAKMEVGEWQNHFALTLTNQPGLNIPDGKDISARNSASLVKTKRKRVLPKLEELDSFEDAFDEPAMGDTKFGTAVAPTRRDEQSFGADTEEMPAQRLSSGPPPIPNPRNPSFHKPTRRISQLLFEGEFESAMRELRHIRGQDPKFRLPKEEHRMLANGLFKARAAEDAAPLLQEYIDRYGADADLQRVKLAVLYVKLLRRPAAALKLLVPVDLNSLSEDYRAIHRKAGKTAQAMISDGVIDAVT